MNTLNIVYVMLQFFAMFYIQKYMSTFFQEVKTRKSVYILSHFIYPILVSTLYFLWNIPLINLLGNIVALFIIKRTTLIISKKPGNTGISRDIRTEFTTDLLLSD